MTVITLLDDPLNVRAPFPWPKVPEYVREFDREYPIVRQLATRAVTGYLDRKMPYFRTARRAYSSFNRRGRYGSKRATFKNSRRYRSKTYPANRATVSTPSRAEVKLDYATATTGNVPYTGNQDEIFMISEGPTDRERIGNVAKLLRGRISGVLQGSSTVGSQSVRVLVYEWKQGYVSPALGSILALGTEQYLSPYHQQNVKNYRVLYDKLFDLNNQSGVAGAFARDIKTFTINFSLNKLVTYLTSANNSGDTRYFIEFYADDAHAALATVEYTASIQFIDL